MLIIVSRESAEYGSDHSVAYTPDMTRDQFIAAAVQNSKLEIIGLLFLGIIPPTVAGFADLHDYIDANTLGSLCDEDLAPVFEAIFPRSPDSRKDDRFPAAFVAATIEVQSQLDAWLRGPTVH